MKHLVALSSYKHLLAYDVKFIAILVILHFRLLSIIMKRLSQEYCVQILISLHLLIWFSNHLHFCLPPVNVYIYALYMYVHFAVFSFLPYLRTSNETPHHTSTAACKHVFNRSVITNLSITDNQLKINANGHFYFQRTHASKYTYTHTLNEKPSANPKRWGE